MISIPAPLLAHISGPIVNLAWCWKVTRKDGQVFGFTTHVSDLVISGLTYAAATGFMVSAIDNSDDLEVDNLSITGVLTSAAFTSNDFQAGIWDSAKLNIFFVNYLDLTMGQSLRFVGAFGEVSRGRAGFTADLVGLTEPLSQRRGELTSKQCRTILGDERCKVDLGPYTRTGAIGAGPTDRSFVDAARTEAINWWAGGNVTITSGAALGQKMEIKKSTDVGYIELVLPILPNFAAGDTYSMTPGCNHLLKAPGPPQTASGVVYHVFDQETVTSLGTYPAGYFEGGVLSWTTGNNAGRSVGILTNGFDGTYASYGMETLQGGVINVGDQFFVTANADVAINFAVTYLGDCKVKYNNVVNFQGEPEIPGMDRTAAFARASA